MRYRAALAMVFAVLMLPVAFPSAAVGGSRGDRLQEQAQARINALRARSGLPALRRSENLTRSASAYARYMLRNDYFGHLPRIRASRRFSSVGEIILLHRGARGQPRLAVSGWAGSPGHRSVMLSSRYHRIGVGKASGSFRGRRVTTWVVHVGRR